MRRTKDPGLCSFRSIVGVVVLSLDVILAQRIQSWAPKIYPGQKAYSCATLDDSGSVLYPARRPGGKQMAGSSELVKTTADAMSCAEGVRSGRGRRCRCAEATALGRSRRRELARVDARCSCCGLEALG